MAATPESTISEAAEAYVNGDSERLGRQLHTAARVHGSHQNDNWNDRARALGDLTNELGRHAAAATGGKPSGDLVEATRSVQLTDDNRVEEMAWWTARGSLDIDGLHIPDASWTVVVKYFGDLDDADGPWKIVHSHFSIHDVPGGRQRPDESVTAA